MRQYIWIVLIVCLAAILRFWQLASVPPALNSDEVAIGYNAYSILRTGRDEFGTPYPLTFRSFDDYKMPVDVYLIAVSMRVFGYSDFAVRFPSAFFGTLTVFLTYLLVRELFKEKGRQYGLVAAFLLAVSPWSILFSRAGYGSNIAVFFTVLATYLLMRGFRASWLLPLSALSFALSIWSYHSSRIFVPLLLIGISVLYAKEVFNRKRAVVVALILGALMVFPLINMTFSTEGKMRAIGVSAFGNPDDLKRTVSWTIRDNGNGLVMFSMLHNRRIEYIRTFLRGYFSHFDVNFLFLDKSIEKYRAPGVGLLYVFELPFFLIGLYQLFRKWSKSTAVVFWWFVIAPVAAAFTLQLPHPGRTQTFLPAIQIITAVGIVEIFQRIRASGGKIVRGGYLWIAAATGVAVISIIYFTHQYFVHLSVDDAAYWYVGRKEMVQKLANLEDQYDRIIVSNNLDFPYIFFLYYAKTDPAVYLQSGGTVSGGFKEEGNRLGKYEFRTITTSLRSAEEKMLFVGLPSDVFSKRLIVDTIYYPDKAPAIVFFR